MEPQTHTTTTSAFHFEVNVDYIKTIPGILKIVQIVLSIICFGCAVGSNRSEVGWVSFVSITGFIHAVFYFVQHLVLVLHHKWSIIIELVIYAVWTLFFLIAGIVAAAMSTQGYWGKSEAGAASAFAFFSMVAWGFDTALQARNVSVTWTSSSTTTTTTAHTSSNTATNTTPPKYDDNIQY